MTLDQYAHSLPDSQTRKIAEHFYAPLAGSPGTDRYLLSYHSHIVKEFHRTNREIKVASWFLTGSLNLKDQLNTLDLGIIHRLGPLAGGVFLLGTKLAQFTYDSPCYVLAKLPLFRLNKKLPYFIEAAQTHRLLCEIAADAANDENTSELLEHITILHDGCSRLYDQRAFWQSRFKEWYW